VEYLVNYKERFYRSSVMFTIHVVGYAMVSLHF